VRGWGFPQKKKKKKESAGNAIHFSPLDSRIGAREKKEMEKKYERRSDPKGKKKTYKKRKREDKRTKRGKYNEKPRKGEEIAR